MKIKLTYTLSLLFAWCSHAQQLNLNLEKGKAVSFKNALFAFGFRQNDFVVYKLNTLLKISDSVFYKLEKAKSADYLSIDCDTTSELLSFQLQKKDKQNATLLRYNQNLKLIHEFKSVDVTKLSPLANFDQQKYIYRNFTYVIKSAIDTGGKQHYLSKFERISSKDKPFEYQFKWQFNFEKKHIQNILVFYADTNQVLAHVHIDSGAREGQWILKINASTGLLMKAKKVNRQADLNYRFGNYCLDSLTKELFIAGQLTRGTQLASATPTLCILRFDSLLNLMDQKQVIQKINPANPKAKAAAEYLMQVPKVWALPHSKYLCTLDFFKRNGNEFKYVNSCTQAFSVEADELIADPVAIKEFQEIENYYFTQDKKDLNGKLFVDTNQSNNLLYFRAPVLAVKAGFYLNENEQPVWLLKKNDPKSGTIHYSVLKPGQKTYETKSLYSLSKDQDPNLILLSDHVFMVYFSKNNSNLVLELGNW